MKICKSILVVLVCLLLAGCNNSSKKENPNQTNIESETSTKKPEEKKPEIKEYERDTNSGQVITITMAEMEEKIKNKETFVVSFETTYCMYCQRLHAILDEYLKTHNVVLYQVILDLEDATEQENLEKIHKYFKEFYTTPGIFYVKKGTNKSYLDTYHLGVEESVFDEWVQQYQIDKKK